MERNPCAPGSRWDFLIRRCISHKSPGLPSAVPPPPPVPRPVWSTSGPVESSIGPSVWVCVGLVAGGSVLVLLLWFLIYKRHRTSQNTAGEKDTTPHTPTTTAQEEEAHSPCLHLNGQTQEVPISEGSCGRSLCNGRVEHGLPLPATELGDSALVTTKTGQPVEV